MRFNAARQSVSILVMAISLALTIQAKAAPSTSSLSWTAPTTRMDGTPLAPTQIKEFRIYYGIDIGDNPLAIGPEYTSVSGENTTKITVDLTPRPEPYVLTFAITTVDRDGLQSPLSEPVTKTFNVKSTANPNPPTSVTFTITCGDGCEVTGVEGQ